ncbi:MAG: hypothetical protein ACLTZQ_09050 [Bifidobacterium longum]
MRMTSGGGTFSPEEIKYLKSLSAVAEATAKRITYTDDFKRYCVVHYNEGASPVRMFREAGLDPALIGYKRIERCLARWRESQDEILNSGNAKAGVENKLGGGFRFGAFPLGSRGRTKHSGRVREQRELGATRRNRHFRLVPAANPISTYRPNVAPSSSPSPAKSRTMTYATC